MANTGGELERLRQDLDEARQQLAATTEVLTTVGRSAPDFDAVLNTVVESARRLCHADIAQIHLVQGNWYRLASSCGHTDEYLEFVTRHPIALDRRTLIGRVGLDRRAQQIHDVLADAEYGRRDIQQIAGYRSILGVPMILDDVVVGVLSVWRTEVDPFAERAIDVLTTFAAQAAIAIHNADLVGTLEVRQNELAAKVEQLVALSEIGQAVSSSLDLDHVLTKIVTHAVQLTDADGGSIFVFDDEQQTFSLRAAFGTSSTLVSALRDIRVGLHETFVGRVALQRKSQQIPDLRAHPLDVHLRTLLEAGWLSMIAVPILRDDRIVGTLVVRRQTAGGFSEEAGELLEAFAGQSALAIINAGLFADLATASRHKSEFLANVSHELRTPLNAVIGFSKVLLERMFGDINERQEEYLQDIWQSGMNLLELVNDILDLAKIEHGRMNLSQTEFSVRDMLESGIGTVRERAAARNVNVTLRVEEAVGTVHADEFRIRQVVLNLLTNAVKFTRQRVDVVARSDGTTLTVSVADDGPGIPVKDRTRIFESFEQGGEGPAKEEGTGLGLTLARRIAVLHGGSLSLESDLGVGSTFSLTVPLTPLDTHDDELADVGLDRSDTPVVVIVEDDPHSRDLLCLYIKPTGVNVVEAADGREGLELIRRLRPAAVILDIQLPILDGWDLLALLKADPATAPIPVVIVSMIDERGKGFALGAAEYLVKPVGRDAVHAALARVAALPDSRQVLVSIGEDPVLLSLVRAALEPEGWTVLSATSGPAGIELATSRGPTVVLVDLLTVGEDGLAVVEALRSNPITGAVPIIALTSQAMTSEDKQRWRGQIDYVNRQSKFDATVLVDVVRRATSDLARSVKGSS